MREDLSDVTPFLNVVAISKNVVLPFMVAIEALWCLPGGRRCPRGRGNSRHLRF